MTPNRFAPRALLLLIALLGALIMRRADVPAQALAAAAIAQQWADASIGQAAETLAGAATLGIPGLRQVAALLIKDQIERRIYWTFSTPRRKADSFYDYQVSATAIAPFAVDVFFIHKQYTISGSFTLQIDTQARRVNDARFDPGSFRFQEIKPAGGQGGG